MYELVENSLGSFIRKTNADGGESHIPIDPANTDYQRYLRWVENPEAEQSIRNLLGSN
jgi:hypothetical protein